MRVLFLAPKECWPPTTGAMLRNYHLAREVARAARVTYLSFNDATTTPDGSLAAANAARDSRETVGAGANPARWCEQVVEVGRGRGYSLTNLARGALGHTPVTVLNYTTREMEHELERVLAAHDFDVVQVESIHLAAYLHVVRAARGRPVALLDWHNVESEIMSRYAERTPGVLRRAYATRTARQLASLEARAVRDFDAHITVSDRDRDQLLSLVPRARVETVENGVDSAHFADEKIERAHAEWLAKAGGTTRTAASDGPTKNNGPANDESQQDEDAARRRVVFVGSMDYHANVDAVVHFAREIWPRLAARLPGIVFSIVGRSPAPEVRELAALPRVEVTGTVEDVRPFYRGALASVVPLRVGGGSRLKILEAMAAGVPVVSTRLGAEGIDARDGVNIMLAETAEEFCEAVESLDADDARRRSLADAGRELVRARYDWSSLGASLLKIYESVIAENSRGRAEGGGARG
ncbi:MAG TPA: glycosyltransferase [Pyrinomonadaceae bacterium]|nr:glycosyltransferase [Pyrinomonadaceae bacterium]